DVEDIYASIVIMEEKASARNIYARKVYLEKYCKVMGELQYTEELTSEEKVYLAKEPKKVDSLPNPPA
ncbi:MAG: hypothetical protein QXG31_01955, partial [Candidatus Bathyarchaeia archaeon]